MDETTYHLSPKFLDRALVIQVAHTELTLPKPPSSTESHAVDEDLYLKLEPAPSAEKVQCSEEYWKDIWDKDVVVWNDKHLLRLGVRLSHRFGQTFLTWMNVAHSVGEDKYKAGDAFFLTKLLPVLSFRSDDIPNDGNANLPDKAGTKKEVLENWIRAFDEEHSETKLEDGRGIKKEKYPETKKALVKMASKSSDFLRYLE